VSELTTKEQANVRAALAFVRARCGSAKLAAKALRVSLPTLRASATPLMVFRVARFASVGLDDVLTGKYPPPGVCAHCGHRKEDAAE
jgi:hypothetical protein